MGRYASYVVLVGNVLFAVWLIRLYMDFRISTRFFWIGAGLYAAFLLVGIVLYKAWATNAAARDDVRAFEVVTHDEEK